MSAIPSPDQAEVRASLATALAVLANATKALSSTNRTTILYALVPGPQSARTLARLIGRPRNLVDYHLAQLLKVKAIEEAGARGGRAKPERFFRLASHRQLGVLPFQALPEALRPAPLEALLDLFRITAGESVRAGMLDGSDGSSLLARPVTLDARAWDEAVTLVVEVDEGFQRLEQESRERIRRMGPAAAIPTVFGSALFRPAPGKELF